MSTRITTGYAALTEREKQTLRLIVRGHDAKSIARSLDLSVHTINERLRDARRKLSVSSSREAARLVLDTEGRGDNFVGDSGIGEAAGQWEVDQGTASIVDAQRPQRRWTIIGVTLMTLILGLLALAALPQQAAPSSDSAASTAATDAAVVTAAQHFLVLGDQGQWEESYRATGAAFQKLNTLQVWTTVSQKVRPPLGAVVSRTLIGQEELPAPPHSYQVVKFRTTFANRADAIETVSLDFEDGGWRVVGITIG